MEKLHPKISKHNFYVFLWHAAFLAIAKNFMDVDTVIPSMLIKSGGTSLHVGILTAIMVGGSHFSQLIFAPWISNYYQKKGLLLTGINLRILSLLGIACLFFLYNAVSTSMIIPLIFIIISIFSFSGAFANISYTDILGKSILENRRKQYLSLRQIISSTGIFISAFLVRQILKTQAYPKNYSLVFLLAGTGLLVASFGFWAIKEFIPAKKKKIQYKFSDIIKEIRANKRLKYYLLIINTVGLGHSLLPFILLFADNNAILNDEMVGNLLVAKTLGLILAGMILFIYSKKANYDTILKIMFAFALVYPIIVLIFNTNALFYYVSFFLGGIFLTLYLVANSGVLLEISSNTNRALYTGISGAGNILPVVFPLLGGSIISTFGFYVFFSIYFLFVISSIIFIHKINCQK